MPAPLGRVFQRIREVFIRHADRLSGSIEYGFPLRHVLPVRKAFKFAPSEVAEQHLAVASPFALPQNVRPRVHEGLPAIGQEHADHFVTVRFLFRHLFSSFRYRHDFRALSCQEEKESPAASIRYGARGRCREGNRHQNQEEAADA